MMLGHDNLAKAALHPGHPSFGGSSHCPLSCVDSETGKVKPRHDDLGVDREPLRQPLPGVLGLKSVVKTVELRDP